MQKKYSISSCLFFFPFLFFSFLFLLSFLFRICSLYPPLRLTFSRKDRDKGQRGWLSGKILGPWRQSFHSNGFYSLQGKKKELKLKTCSNNSSSSSTNNSFFFVYFSLFCLKSFSFLFCCYDQSIFALK